MATLRIYLRIQLMTFMFGLVGPIFLVVFFAAQPEPDLRWMYWWGLLITAADILVALVLTEATVRAGRAVEAARRSAQAST